MYPFQSQVNLVRKRYCGCLLILTKLLGNKTDFPAQTTSNLFSPNQKLEYRNLSMQRSKRDSIWRKMIRLLQLSKLMWTWLDSKNNFLCQIFQIPINLTVLFQIFILLERNAICFHSIKCHSPFLARMESVAK